MQRDEVRGPMEQSCFLIGARGVGKTFIGGLLARRLEYEFHDTDELIRQRTGMTIADIVEQQGWVVFRLLENEALRDCSLLGRAVVATGGGAVLHQDVWPQIKERALVVWLTAPVEIVLRRMAADADSPVTRPSLTGKGNRLEYETVLREREPLYRAIADRTIATGSLDSDRIVADIVRMVQFPQEKQTGICR